MTRFAAQGLHVGGSSMAFRLWRASGKSKDEGKGGQKGKGDTEGKGRRKRGTLYFFGVEEGRVQPFKVTREQVDTLSNDSVFRRNGTQRQGDTRLRGSYSSRLCVAETLRQFPKDECRHLTQAETLREFRYGRFEKVERGTLYFLEKVERGTLKKWKGGHCTFWGRGWSRAAFQGCLSTLPPFASNTAVVPSPPARPANPPPRPPVYGPALPPTLPNSALDGP